jgi:hypothetical protein
MHEDRTPTFDIGGDIGGSSSVGVLMFFFILLCTQFAFFD